MNADKIRHLFRFREITRETPALIGFRMSGPLGRSYLLVYYKANRRFIAEKTNRKGSMVMLSFKQSRAMATALSPEQIAHCMAASIAL